MKKYQDALERMSNEAVEYVRGVPVVKTFGQTVFSFHRFKKAIDDYGNFCLKTLVKYKPIAPLRFRNRCPSFAIRAIALLAYEGQVF